MHQIIPLSVKYQRFSLADYRQKLIVFAFLPALGQVMLYVDGMNGVIAHNGTVQWLYSLTASKVRQECVAPAARTVILSQCQFL